MKLGETAEVIRHTITLVNGKNFTIYQQPNEYNIDRWVNDIAKAKATIFNPAMFFYDIHNEFHLFYIKDVAHHSMKLVKVTLKAADPNPLNENYGEDEVS